MMMTNSLLLVVALLWSASGWSVLESHAFSFQSVVSPHSASSSLLQQQQQQQQSQQRRHSWRQFGTPSDTIAGDSIVTQPKETDVEDDDDDDTNGGGTETLILRGVISTTSKELPAASSETLLQFLQEPRHRNLMLTAGGKRPLEQFDLTPDLVEEWKLASLAVGSQAPDSIPDPTAAVFKVQSGNINFAGVQVTSLSRLGCKLLFQDDAEQQPPVYEVLQLGDERSVSGFAPMVYIYHKLTGGVDQKKEKDDIDSDITTPTKKKKGTKVTALSRISYQRNTDNNTIVFTANAQVNVAIQFPAFLLKILPTNKEKAEASGGASISKALVKDVDAAIQALGEAYEAYLLEQK